MNFLYHLVALVNCTKRVKKSSIKDLSVPKCTEILNDLITMAEQRKEHKSKKTAQDRLNDLKGLNNSEKIPNRDLISSFDNFLRLNGALWKYLRQRDWKSMNRLFKYRIFKLCKVPCYSNESMFELVREKIKKNPSILKMLPELRSIILISIYDISGEKIYCLFDSLAKLMYLLEYYELCTRDNCR
jgi:hypothetical protein